MNIMVYRPDGDSPLHVVLVGWGCAGVDGTVKSPITLNSNMPRHQNAMVLCPIQKRHDMFMFDQLFTSL